ncbi:DNA polymerase III subunit delta' [Sphingomicrobium lutaoense]|uniref:DNA polymerase-3 subunit delta n=1 Tax=Sphingomicrobium lutaoense TaxID=515949 RepID=A0A839YZA0_9SPHN|nr:DNA polymerase III subunit delta' [Sphingomicrobium lutaoense]MBB3763790.1 DNA polymerase-3 subunit delta' [Sphingomicrobium lutaoense]
MIVGQDAAIDAFFRAWRGGTPHHAWLLSGPRGVGKASFAKAAATRILAEGAGQKIDLPPPAVPSDSQTVSMMEAGSHPDFRLLTREMNDRKTAQKRNISVDQVRSIATFLGITPSLSPWRVILIDSADDLEAGGANALLKMLEEPPENTIFLLVSHAPGRLLPTIRSRCRRLGFQPLGDDVMASLLAEHCPEMEATGRQALIDLSQGSIGRALALAEMDLLPQVAAARSIMCEGDPTLARRADLVRSLSNKANAERYAAFLDMLPAIVAEEVRQADAAQRPALLKAYEEVRRIAATAPRLSLDPGATVMQLSSALAHAAPQPA